MRNWEPDVRLDLASANAIVCRRFPSFQGLDPWIIGRGWDNLCVAYPTGTVFRLPTRALAGETVKNELAALPALAPWLALPIPSIEFVGGPDDDYPYDFFGYRMLEGCSAEFQRWTTGEMVGAASQLGGFLRTLHDIPTMDRAFDRLPGDLLHRAVPRDLADKVRRRGGQVMAGSRKRADWATGLIQSAEAELEGVATSGPTSIVHGDLYPRHVLADAARSVTGVIDWGDVHKGHPAVDLSLGFTFFVGASREAFWKAYGGRPESDWLRLARARAVNYALALCAYGLDVDDAATVALADSIGENCTSD